MTRILRRLISDEAGQDLVEYGLLVALIAVIAAASVSLLGPAISAGYSTIAATFQSWF